MTKEQLFGACLEAAQRIVAHYRALLPEDVELFALGGGKNEVDTKYRREGTTSQVGAYNLTGYPALAGLLQTQASGSQPTTSNVGARNSFLYNLLTRSDTAVPGEAALTEALGLSPTSFDGRSSLQSIAGINPLSSTYEADTQSAYQQRAGDALAQLQSGHEAVRGGQSRSGLASGVMAERLAAGRGEELRRARTSDAAMVGGASQLLQQIEQLRRGVKLGAQQQYLQGALGRSGQGLGAAGQFDQNNAAHLAALELAARFLGGPSQVVTDDTSGKGMQAGSQFNWSFLKGIIG